MHKIKLTYSLADDKTGGANVHHPLFAMLEALHRLGSVSAAAAHLGFSYRHVWGELHRWESELGRELVVWSKGQRALLTPFGEKLLWAERRAQARLAPQIDALRMELERAFADVFDDRVDVLSLCASHDQALPLLRDLAREDQLHLDVHFMPSLQALRALDAGRCLLAGFHVREGAARGSISAQAYRARLQPGRHKLIGFVRRTQGLMVAPARAASVRRLEDLLAPGLRFVGRPEDTGTRVLLQELMHEAGLPMPAESLLEPSHTAAARAVASGAADAGFGIEAAAHACGLAFVPIATEHYYLATLKSHLELPSMQRLCALLKSAQWQACLDSLAGYESDQPGEVLPLTRVLPWWSYRTPRTHPRDRAGAAPAVEPVGG